MRVLGELPNAVEFAEEGDDKASVTLCFVHEPDSLTSVLSRVRTLARTTKLWILWRKGRSAQSGVTERLVREQAIDVGLVDYKICSVNETWSALLFASR